jgi:hypothetical protein
MLLYNVLSRKQKDLFVIQRDNFTSNAKRPIAVKSVGDSGLRLAPRSNMVSASSRSPAKI